jgi:hypothetical protein
MKRVCARWRSPSSVGFRVTYWPLSSKIALRFPVRLALSLVLVWTLCAKPSPSAQQRSSVTGSLDNKLKQFLHKYLSDPRFLPPDKTTHVSSAVVKRGDGSIEEIIVYLSGESWCGSSGCYMYVLEPYNSSYKLIGEVSIVKLPIRILPTTSNGHHDIAVFVQGGGIVEGYEAILQFNGKRYPSNPTVSPARRLPKNNMGDVLIAVGQYGQALFE